MLWALLLPFLALGAGPSSSTFQHLRSLEATAARLKAEGNQGKYYDKVNAEIARIKKEYEITATPKGEAGATSGSGADWQRKKDDFMQAAEDELKRRGTAGGASRFYASQAEWRKVYEAQMQFAQGRVAAGGLGLEFQEADAWVRRQMESVGSAQISTHRKRYAKAVFYLQTPAAKGGPGYVRGYARKMALELAGKTDSELDRWIAQDKAARAPAGFARFRQSCESWFRSFGG